jgi:hypothetical protein
MRSATGTGRMHSAAAAYSAAAVGVLYAGISAYWAAGGTALLTAVGNAVEPHARTGAALVAARMAHRRSQTGRERTRCTRHRAVRQLSPAATSAACP